MTIQFTRYLYSKDQVVDSFRQALVERQKDAALFWIYELYFSGFVEEAWFQVDEMYALYWEKANPRLRKHLEDRTKGGDARIGSMVLTLCIRDKGTESKGPDHKGPESKGTDHKGTEPKGTEPEQ